MDIFLETCDHIQGIKMRHCPYYLKTLNRTDNPAKRQPVIKSVFVSQNVANRKY
jgi:hypothetical protein